MHTMLTLAALAGAALLTVTFQRSAHHDSMTSARSEIEARGAAVANELLDLASTLPLEGAGGPAPASFEEAGALDDWHGLERGVSVPTGERMLTFRVTASVQPVTKAGDQFVASSRPAPYRLVRLRLAGPLGTALGVERVVASPAP